MTARFHRTHDISDFYAKDDDMKRFRKIKMTAIFLSIILSYIISEVKQSSCCAMAFSKSQLVSWEDALFNNININLYINDSFKYFREYRLFGRNSLKPVRLFLLGNGFTRYSRHFGGKYPQRLPAFIMEMPFPYLYLFCTLYTVWEQLRLARIRIKKNFIKFKPTRNDAFAVGIEISCCIRFAIRVELMWWICALTVSLGHF